MARELKCLFGFHRWNSYHEKPSAFRTCKDCLRMYQYSYDGYAPYWARTGKKQYTFVYCQNCHLELCAGGDLIEDTDLVRYKCARCGTRSAWYLDAPVPIFIENDRKSKGVRDIIEQQKVRSKKANDVQSRLSKEEVAD